MPGSLHLAGIFLCKTADKFSPALTFSFLSFLLLVHSSFKNFAYLGTCLIASSRGMFTSTFLNVSKISLSRVSLLALANLEGKGGAVLKISSSMLDLFCISSLSGSLVLGVCLSWSDFWFRAALGLSDIST
ncbi:hypothetical protein RND81_08G112200 [Saponaria officinalis]|uniref:Uncharacterized protein n=1 Tax=Saponaria officinalis TaxID=3572 RepID=A0AAW1J6S4_SAPOF